MGNANEPGLKDFELSLSELLDVYRNRYDRRKVIDALNAQAGLLVGDDGWTGDTPEPVSEDVLEGPDAKMGEDEKTRPTAA